MMGSSVGGFIPPAVDAFFNLLKVVGDPDHARKIIEEIEDKLKELAAQQEAVNLGRDLMIEERRKLEEQASALELREADIGRREAVHGKNLEQHEADKRQLGEDREHLRDQEDELLRKREEMNRVESDLARDRQKALQQAVAIDAREVALEREREKFAEETRKTETELGAANRDLEQRQNTFNAKMKELFGSAA